jgi:hypothetical protein
MTIAEAQRLAGLILKDGRSVEITDLQTGLPIPLPERERTAQAGAVMRLTPPLWSGQKRGADG